jgi:hypothetical protein
METVSALGGPDVVASSAVMSPHPLILGAIVTGLFRPGPDGSFGNAPYAIAIVPNPIDWTSSEPSMGSGFLGGGLGYRTAGTPSIAPEQQPSRQLGEATLAAHGSGAALTDYSARGEELAHASARAKISADRLPYVSLIRAMLDRDQVASARTLLSVAIAEQPGDGELRTVARILARPTSVRRVRRDCDRSREYAWLTSHEAEHRGRWIAVVGETLVGSAESLKQLLLSLEASGHTGRALIHRAA